MEKNAYIAPQMEVIEIENASMLAASKPQPEIGVGEGSVGAGGAWSNDRRGTWGNLWDDGEKK